ncbi:hypothetical protein ABN763_12460 [Spongiivirga sp. MCCC 1A20706]|uniref:hypothetical protein n=1 Tax=Spongiivirga sp. MCCC 1A20706 TaxID=3160963 RepID=UPI003977B857
MESFNLLNFALLASLYTCITVFIAVIFKLRTKFGIGLVFTGIGAFQFLQTYLANTITLEISSVISISPGTIMFHASLFVVLLILVKEGSNKARTLLYAILFTNLFLCAIQYALGYSFPRSPMASLFNSENIGIGIKTFSLGTLLLFVDGLLIFFLFNKISKLNIPFFLNALVSMSFVFFFDAIIFLVVIQGIDFEINLVYNSVVKSLLSSLVYSSLFTLYFALFEVKKSLNFKNNSFGDVISFLLYRKQMENIQKKLEHQERVFSDQLFYAESRFRVAGEIANLGYWKYDKHTKSMILNDHIMKLYGISTIDFNNYVIPFTDFVERHIPKQEKEEYLKKVKSIDLNKAPSRTEIKHKAIFGNGAEGRVLTVVMAEKDPKSGQIEVYGISRILEAQLIPN